MKVVAEAGVNHNGSLDLALELVDAAVGVGADCVKFQTFQTGKLVTALAERAAYQERNFGAGRQQSMLAALELSRDAFVKLARHCREQRIEFLSTPFDQDSARFLVEELGCDTLKLGSGDLDNLPMLVGIGRMGVKLILSTGMALLGDIELALGALVWGANGMTDEPRGREELLQAYADADEATLRARVVLLHCATEYPAPPASLNLHAIGTMRRAFNLEVGFSDHSEGDWAALAAQALGAVMLEKHITLDRSMDGPDHAASMEPDDFAAMVARIRKLSTALGTGRKRSMPAERPNISIARKRVVAARHLRKGETPTLADLALKRSDHGAPASLIYDLVRRPLVSDVSADEGIG